MWDKLQRPETSSTIRRFNDSTIRRFADSRSPECTYFPDRGRTHKGESLSPVLEEYLGEFLDLRRPDK